MKKGLLQLVSGIILGTGAALLIVPGQVDFVWISRVRLIQISDDLKIGLALVGGLMLTLFAIGVLVRKLLARI